MICGLGDEIFHTMGLRAGRVIKRSLGGACSVSLDSGNLGHKLGEKAHVILQIPGSLQSTSKEKAGKQEFSLECIGNRFGTWQDPFRDESWSNHLQFPFNEMCASFQKLSVRACKVCSFPII